MNTVQITQVTPAELAEMIADKVRAEMQSLSVRLQEKPTPDKPQMSRREAAQFFGVSVNCVHDWVKRGILKPYKMGNRTYFLRSECLEVLLNSNRG
jgi:hypothetical protein